MSEDRTALERKQRERQRARDRLRESVLAQLPYGVRDRLDPALQELGLSCLFQLDQALSNTAPGGRRGEVRPS